MLNLASVLEESVKNFPDKKAVILGNQSFSFTQINAAANQVANGLQRAGIHKGDKVALSCPNIPYFPIVYYGILKTGATVVPLNVLLKQREIAYHLNDSDAKAYFCFEGTAELPMGQEGWAGFNHVDSCHHFWLMTADPAAESPIAGAETLGAFMSREYTEFDTVQTMPDDTCVILYTSGTTGQPKGAELTHSNIFMNAVTSRDLFHQKAEDIQLVVLPLFHSFGQTCQLNTGFMGSNTLVFIPRFDADAVLSGFQNENVTIFCGVPTMYWGLLKHPEAGKYDLDKIARNLRLGISGGAAMPLEIMKAFEEKFNIKILEGYGLSETSPVATFNRFDRPRKPGSIGLPIWGVDVKIVDENDKELPVGEPGEVIIRGHNVMKGYYKRPDATETAFRNGWFHSGDVGKKDEDGYIYIVDRVKDMIVRGGYNVYPREIEEVLLTHPAISLAAVIGVPHDKFGEDVKAYVVLKENASATVEELQQWAKEEMASYKYPRMIEIRDSLPMTATGKILKKELRKL